MYNTPVMDGMAYTPAPHALDHLAEVDFVAVIGPTAAGKTTLIHEAVRREPRLHIVLNNTSRARRAGEQEGVDYHFETRTRMEERIARGEYAQVAPSIFGDLYATAAGDYAAEGIALMPVLADAMLVFRALPFKSIRSIFIVPPAWEVWQERVARHHFTPERLAGRMAEARRSLEFALADAQTRFVVSSDVSEATADFITLTLDEPLSPRLQQDQTDALPIIRRLIMQLEQQFPGAASL